MKQLLIFILPICSLFSAQTLRSKNLISSSFSRRLWAMVTWEQRSSPAIRTPNLRPRWRWKVLAMDQISIRYSPCLHRQSLGLLTGTFSRPDPDLAGWLNPDSPRGNCIPRKFVGEGFERARLCYIAMYGKWHLGTTSLISSTSKWLLMLCFGLPYHATIWFLQNGRNYRSDDWGNDTLELNPDQTKLTTYTTQKSDWLYWEKNWKNPFSSTFPFANAPCGRLFSRMRTFRANPGRGLYGDVIEKLNWCCGWDFDLPQSQMDCPRKIRWFGLTSWQWPLGSSRAIRRLGLGSVFAMASSTWEGDSRALRLLGVA